MVWVRWLKSSRRWVWLAFALVVVFLIAQVSWWLIFQRQYIQQNIEYAETTWLHEAALLQELWPAIEPSRREALIKEMGVAFPHIEVQGETVFVNPERLVEYRAEQLGYLRMFAYEGPFFLLVMLGGLWIIAHSLRSEQEFKRRQQNFLMAASHEFRTPISTLRLLVQTLLLRELSKEKQQAYLTHMGHEVDRLEDLSERLLATSRLAQGMNQVRASRLEFDELVRQILERQREVLEARGARLHFDSGPNPVLVDLDPEAFGLVLSNLLDNAVKYSPGAEKPVWIRLWASQTQAVLEVEDRGIGIRRTEAAHIFEPFYRVGDEQTRNTRGLGLGLYLVRGITELMGGSVQAEPLPQGTRFSLRFPLAQPTPTSRPERNPV
jgi:signal transduction histidine kinase